MSSAMETKGKTYLKIEFGIVTWRHELGCALLRSVCSELVVLSPAVLTLTTFAHGFKEFALAWQPYLLGLLAMIKCSICSYQCDN